jgi:hypothetical protein
MAQVTVFYRPGNVSIMASTTIFTIDDLQHVYFISAGFEFEAKISMAYLAAEPDTVKPVWKNNRSHTGRIRIVIYYNITVFRVRIASHKQIYSNEYHTKQKHNGQNQVLVICVHVFTYIYHPVDI